MVQLRPAFLNCHHNAKVHRWRIDISRWMSRPGVTDSTHYQNLSRAINDFLKGIGYGIAWRLHPTKCKQKAQTRRRPSVRSAGKSGAETFLTS